MSAARGRWRTRAFAAVLAVSLVAVLTFLALPILAIFVHSPPSRLISALGEPAAREALLLSLETTTIAMAVIVVFGTPAAYLLATRRLPGQDAVLTLIELPLVLPPAVAGIALLAALGPEGILGGALSSLRHRARAQTAGVVVALTFVSSPFYLRQAQAAFAAVDRSSLDASRTLGAREARTLVRVAMPARAAWPLPRASRWRGGGRSGEFGATLMFAGSFRGRHPDRAAGDLRPVRRPTSRPRSRCRRCSLRGLRRAAPHREADRRAGGARPCSTLEATTRARRRWTLDVELAVPAGECLALVGPSGAGKTTILRVAAGLADPDVGRVVCGEEVWLDTAAGVDVAPEHRGCGYVFQDYALFGHLDRPRQRRATPAAPGGDGSERRRRASGRRSTASAPERWRPRDRRTSAAANASGSRSRGRWPGSRAHSCSTSRSRRSTRATGPGRRTSCSAPWRPPKSRCCS